MYALRYAALLSFTLCLLISVNTASASILPARLAITTSGATVVNSFFDSALATNGYFIEGGIRSAPFDLKSVDPSYPIGLNSTPPYSGAFTQTGDGFSVLAAAGDNLSLSAISRMFSVYFETDMHNKTATDWRLTWDLEWSLSVGSSGTTASSSAEINVDEGFDYVTATPHLDTELSTHEIVGDALHRSGKMPMVIDLHAGENARLSSNLRLYGNSFSLDDFYAAAGDISFTLRSAERLSSVPAPYSLLLFAAGLVLLGLSRQKKRLQLITQTHGR